MNRKLQKLLKNTYAKETPDRKSEFIGRIKNDPTWRRLHPFGSFFSLHPTAKPIAAALTAAAACLLIAMIAFGNDRSPQPDKPPEIITEVDVTTSAVHTEMSTETITTSVRDDITEKPDTSQTETGKKGTKHIKNSSVSTKTTASAKHVNVPPAENIPNTTRPFATSQPKNTTYSSSASSAHTEITSTAAVNTTAPVTTSVIKLELFRHDYTVNELKDDETLGYGYPDRYLLRDVFRVRLEDRLDGNETLPTLLDLLNEMTDDEVSKDFLSLLLWNPPYIAEGDVSGKEYIVYDKKPWTLISLDITKVYHFKDDKIINKGDTIKIAVAGGYMPLKQYMSLYPDDKRFNDLTADQIENTFIYSDGGIQREIREGDHFAAILELSKLDLPGEDIYTLTTKNDITLFDVYDDYIVSANSSYSSLKAEKEWLDDGKDWRYYHDPDSSRTIAFRNDSFLLGGEFACYSIDENERYTYLGSEFTDDGFFPFHEPRGTEQIYHYYTKTVERDHYILTWTETGVTLKYHFDSLMTDPEDFTTLEFVIPK